MGRGRQIRRSDLFLVRVWTEDVEGRGEAEMRGRVQRTISGETHNFRTWPELVNLLAAMVEAERSAATGLSLEVAISPQDTP